MPKLDVNKQPVHVTFTFEQIEIVRQALEQFEKQCLTIAENGVLLEIDRQSLLHRNHLAYEALRALPDLDEYCPF